MTIAVSERSRKPRTASRQRLRLWLRILRSSRAIEGELRERLRITYGITLPQFDVMAALYRRVSDGAAASGMTMTELSRFLMVSNGNVTGIIDRLVADGLVSRKAAAEDRRAILVELTPQGIARFAEMAGVHEGWVDDLLSEFTKAEAEVLIAHLDGLADRIRKGGRRA